MGSSATKAKQGEHEKALVENANTIYEENIVLEKQLKTRMEKMTELKEENVFLKVSSEMWDNCLRHYLLSFAGSDADGGYGSNGGRDRGNGSIQRDEQ